MTEAEIVQLFNHVVHDKEAMKKLDATKHQVFNWRHPERKKTSTAAMLEVLWKTGHLKFENFVRTDGDIIPFRNEPKQ
ncbi:hypothetical protein [Maribacter flavus]|uniref:Uncharacterized protein n=1 Tax=Maribacter flavus TaxID=1658664 RepID=A0A5B2TVU4_9FLAO|nr:hypothetical protein [Maribacter flavus]KAA2218243.1 hypothetical protein F0361_01085 [Maribacter flavus]